MNTIKFNETECTLLTFNKNMYFNNGVVSGNLTCEVETSDMTSLQALSEIPVTSIEIEHDEEIIYNVSDTYARLSSINEYLSEDRIHITLNFDLSRTQTE